MAEPVLMPQAGQTMTEGKIVRWFFKEGDKVQRGDPLLEIETDKANMDVEAPSDGVLLKVLHSEGEIVPVLQAVGVIAAPGEKVDLDAFKAPAAGTSQPEPVEEKTASRASADVLRTASPPGLAGAGSVHGTRAGPSIPAAAHQLLTPEPQARASNSQSTRLRVSPLARRIARMRGVNLQTLRGTGPQGRILRRDVESAVSLRTGSREPGTRAAGTLREQPETEVYPPPSPRPPERIPLKGMRKVIAESLQRSKVQAPHYYVTMEIDGTRALTLREELNAQGVQATINDLIVYAVAIALTDEPRANCRVFEDSVEYPAVVNIGIAVGLDDGLVVPAVLNAGERNLQEIVEESRRVIEAARRGKLVGTGQGTFTVSNLGMYGVDSFTAVINPPEGAILAVGAAVPRLVAAGGGFLQRTMLKVTLSADHRAIDGVVAAKFLKRVKILLEDPSRLIR